jgi:hypothetical protein
VRFRSYLTGDRYCVILESKKNVEGDVELRAVGEDSTYPVRLASARDLAAGADFTIRGARITRLKLKAGVPTRIEVVLQESSGSLCLSLAR